MHLFKQSRAAGGSKAQQLPPAAAVAADPGLALGRQFSDATVSVLAKQVQAGTALAKSTSVADSARPDLSLANDLVALEQEIFKGFTSNGVVATDLVLKLPAAAADSSGGEGERGGIAVHRAILVARSAYLRDLVLSTPAGATWTDVPASLDQAELRAAVRMCYVGEAQQWAMEAAEKQLAEEKRRATEAAAAAADTAGTAATEAMEEDGPPPSYEDSFPAYPPEWEGRVGNLIARFSGRPENAAPPFFLFGMCAFCDGAMRSVAKTGSGRGA
jgi:hypothetical protein